jgi:hypothetical protein
VTRRRARTAAAKAAGEYSVGCAMVSYRGIKLHWLGDGSRGWWRRDDGCHWWLYRVVQDGWHGLVLALYGFNSLTGGGVGVSWTGVGAPFRRVGFITRSRVGAWIGGTAELRGTAESLCWANGQV